MKKLQTVLILVLLNLPIIGQELRFDKVEMSDSISLSINMQNLANGLLLSNTKSGDQISIWDLYRLQTIKRDYQAALESITELRNTNKLNEEEELLVDYCEQFTLAKIKQEKGDISFEEVYQEIYSEYIRNCHDLKALKISLSFVIRDRTGFHKSNFTNAYNGSNAGFISTDKALSLLKKYYSYSVRKAATPSVFKEVKNDQSRRYDVQDDILLPMKDGGEVHVVVVQRKGQEKSLPALLAFTIYAEKNSLWAMLSASKGYVGVMAYSRGKGISKNEIEPFIHENKDVYEVIDWVSRQSWCNEKVGMYGGSYDGFTQWASMKHKVHPSLKTIVPSVSVAPGIDYPMENNVLFNFSYSWNFMVKNNKYLDSQVAGDFQRWNNLKSSWYQSGVAFNKLDSIDGEENEMFTQYMSHPSYDTYWQRMIPYREEFSKIDIPVLTISGYYDDAQRGAIHYYNEHLKYNKNANHYLLIGPYDHWTAQDGPLGYLRGYKLDKSSLLNIRYELLYQWFDYILKDGKKPAILKDKVNFQVMDANKWLHKPSLSEMANDSLVFQLQRNASGAIHKLVEENADHSSSIKLQVDFSDRTKSNNEDYYPWPLLKDSINLEDGLVFMSDTLSKETIINGSFGGELIITTNKKDVDVAVNLFELTPENKYFSLSNYIGRASYATNREKRMLLAPHKPRKIEFSNTKIISKKINKGSRIVVVINVNKNLYGQINYGTGKDVNTESIKDSDIPLELSIGPNSKILIPIWNNE